MNHQNLVPIQMKILPQKTHHQLKLQIVENHHNLILLIHPIPQNRNKVFILFKKFLRIFSDSSDGIVEEEPNEENQDEEPEEQMKEEPEPVTPRNKSIAINGK